ncbi:hypothetical protein Syun_023746 [Stephania yunnanensis]|uniref:beta-galactosidase n=1 Tax=Stephania yunnanensis TaxID=152371 RepID=A0AAP0FD10_9MAGN
MRLISQTLTFSQFQASPSQSLSVSTLNLSHAAVSPSPLTPSHHLLHLVVSTVCLSLQNNPSWPPSRCLALAGPPLSPSRARQVPPSGSPLPPRRRTLARRSPHGTAVCGLSLQQSSSRRSEWYDLVQFIKLVKQAGLYVHLRIGPYGVSGLAQICSRIRFRTDNEPFKADMKKFTQKIVDMMKAEELFESQGGPIILAQIENEYGPMEYEIGTCVKYHIPSPSL